MGATIQWGTGELPINVNSVAGRESDFDIHVLPVLNQFKDGLTHELLRIIYMLELSVANANRKKIASGDWNYIPFSHMTFYKEVMKAIGNKHPRDLKFLELGCGLGTKLYIVERWCGVSAYGIEKIPKYAKVAKEMIGKKNRIFCQDVSDFKNFGDYDILYSYCVLPKEDIKNQMKSGAILLKPRHEPYIKP